MSINRAIVLFSKGVKNDSNDLFEQALRYFKKLLLSKSDAQSREGYTELYVIAAEAAFHLKLVDTSETILNDLFLLETIPHDEFYCRAKLLYARIIHLRSYQVYGIEKVKVIQNAMYHLMQAYDIAISPNYTTNSHYQLILYNCTFYAWTIIHPLLSPQLARFVSKDMQKLCTSMQENASQKTTSSEDDNRMWQVQFLAATSYCICDEEPSASASNNGKLACDLLDKAINMVNISIQQKRKHEIELVNNISTFIREYKSLNGEIHSLENQIEGLVKQLHQAENTPQDDDNGEVEELIHIQQDVLQSKEVQIKAILEKKNELELHVRTQQSEISELNTCIGSLYMQRVHANLPDSKRFLSTTPEIANNIMFTVRTQIQCVLSGVIPVKEHPVFFQSILTAIEQANKGKKISKSVIAECYADVSRVALRFHLNDLAQQCYLKASAEKECDSAVKVKVDLYRANQLATTPVPANITDAEGIVTRRKDGEIESLRFTYKLEALKILERILPISAVELKDDELTLEICCAIWNTSIVFLQPHLRQHIYRVFVSAAQILETQHSKMFTLRAQIQYEIAKYEESKGLVKLAVEHCEKALEQDYSPTVPQIQSANSVSNVVGQNQKIVTPAPVIPSTAEIEVKSTMNNSSGVRYDQFNKLRKLDRYIVPLYTRLLTRIDVHGRHNSAEDKAMTYLEQYLETTSTTKQIKYLHDALLVMLRGPLHLENIADILGNDSNLSTSFSTTTTLSSKKQDVHVVEWSDLEQYTTPITPITPLITPITPTALTMTPGKLDTILDTHYSILFRIAMYAHAHHLPHIVQICFIYLMRYSWDVADEFMKEYIQMQIEVCYLLAESLVDVLETITLNSLSSKTTGMRTSNIKANKRSALESARLGLTHALATEEMMVLKRLVISSVNKGIALSLTVNDFTYAHNGIVVFFNLHLHVFRENLYENAVPQYHDSLKYCAGVIDKVRAEVPNSVSSDLANDTLRGCMYEAYIRSLELTGSLSQAVEVCTKACSSTAYSVYSRRRLVDLACALGKKAAALPKAKPIEPPKYDNPLLNVFASLHLAETSTAAREVVVGMLQKTASVLNNEVVTFLRTVKWESVSRALYDELLEMQVECWTRLAGAHLKAGGALLAQQAAEAAGKCVDKELLLPPGQLLSGRVWRWLSVSARVLGCAVYISSGENDGKDEPAVEGDAKTKREELLVLSLRHLSRACSLAARTDASCRPPLLYDAAALALPVLAQILHSASISVTTSATSASTFTTSAAVELGHEIVSELARSQSSAERDQALMSKYYLLLVDALFSLKNTTTALQYIEEGLLALQPAYQPALFKQKIFALSSLGEDVSPWLLKLSKEEKDVTQQAAVYAMLARSTQDPILKCAYFKKAVEYLEGVDDSQLPTRFEYLLEIAQWTSVTTTAVAGTSFSAAVSIKGTSPFGMADDGIMEILTYVRPFDSVPTVNLQYLLVEPSKASLSEPPPTSRQLTMQLLDIAVRTCIMMGLCARQNEDKMPLFLEAVSRVRQSAALLSHVLTLSYLHSKYALLSSAEKESLTMLAYFDQHTGVDVPRDLMFSLDEPLESLTWQPSPDFKRLATSLPSALRVYFPSTATLICLPLTFRYCRELVNYLVDYGYTKSALQVLSWMRVLVLCVGGQQQQRFISYLSWIQFVAMHILMRSGSAKEAALLAQCPDYRDFLEYLGKVPGLPLSHWQRMTTSKYYTGNAMTEDLNVDATTHLSTLLETARELHSIGELELSGKLAHAVVAFLEGLLSFSSLPSASIRQAILTSTLLIAQQETEQASYSSAIRRILRQLAAHEELLDIEFTTTAVQLLSRCYIGLAKPEQAIEVVSSAVELLSLFWRDDKPSAKASSVVPSRGFVRALTMKTTTGGTGGGDTSASIHANNLVALSSSLTAVVDPKVAAALVSLTQSLAQALVDQLASLLASPIRTSSTRDITVESVFARVHNLLTMSLDIVRTSLRENSKTEAVLRLSAYKRLTKLLSVDPLVMECPEDLAFEIRTEALVHLETARTCYEQVVSSIPVAEKSSKNATSLDGVLSSTAGTELAEVLVQLAGEEIKSSARETECLFVSMRPSRLAQLSVIERYLLTSKPPPVHTLADFRPPHLARAMDLCAQAKQLSSFHREDCDVLSCVAEVACVYGTEVSDWLWDTTVADVDVDQEYPSLAASLPLLEDLRSRLQASVLSAVHTHRFDLAAAGCKALFMSYGKRNAVLAAKWLLELQSVYARRTLSKIARQGLAPASPLCALWHQVEARLGDDTACIPRLDDDAHLQARLTRLSELSAPWRQLSLLSACDPLASLQLLPKGCHVLSLQFNTDMSVVYTCLVATTPTGTVVDAAVDRTVFSREQHTELASLLAMHSIWKKSVTAYVVAGGGSVDPEEAGIEVDEYFDAAAPVKTAVDIEKAFLHTVRIFNGLLEGALGKESEIYKYAVQSLGNDSKPLVFLADVRLHALPLEALSIVELFKGGSCRDYSIDMLAHRLQNTPTAPIVYSSALKYVVDPFGDDKDDQKSVNSGTAGLQSAQVVNKSKSLSREHNKAAAKKAANGTVVKDVDVISGHPSIGTNFQRIKSKLGSKWLSMLSDSNLQVPSIQDWRAAVGSGSDKPSSLFVHIPGNVSSVLDLRELATLNCERVLVSFIMSGGYNDASYRRQVDRGRARSQQEVALDQYVPNLLSLSGCSSMVVSQWSTTFASQVKFTTRFWEAFTQHFTLNEAVTYASGSSELIPKEPVKNTKKNAERKPIATASMDSAASTTSSEEKSWLRYSRVCYGIPSVSYSEG